MCLITASLLFHTGKCQDRIELEASTIVDVIEAFVTSCGDEVRKYFYLDNGDFNGATFVTINGKSFTIREAAKIPLRESDNVLFGQIVDGG
jgi:hypothetical protein